MALLVKKILGEFFCQSFFGYFKTKKVKALVVGPIIFFAAYLIVTVGTAPLHHKNDRRRAIRMKGNTLKVNRIPELKTVP